MTSLRRFLPLVAACTLAVLAPAVARADGELAPLPGPIGPAAQAATVATGIIADAVFLRSGAMMRGTVYELVPGDHVTVLGPNGQIWSVPWAQVEKVELGNRPSLTQVPAAVTPVAPLSSGKPPKKGPMVRVHIDSKRAVQLYRQPAQDGGWYEECTSPCDVDMPLNDDYRISGSGIFQSRDFHLEGSAGGHVVIAVDPSTRSTFLLGGVLTAVGGIIDYVGLLTLAAASTSSYACTTNTRSSYSYSGSSCSYHDSDSGSVIGAGILIAGTAMMVTGVIIMLANGSTGVSQSESSTRTASVRPLDSYRREAIWHTPNLATPAAPPALSLPLFSKAF